MNEMMLVTYLLQHNALNSQGLLDSHWCFYDYFHSVNEHMIGHWQSSCLGVLGVQRLWNQAEMVGIIVLLDPRCVTCSNALSSLTLCFLLSETGDPSNLSHF